jgi:hypothetical protein
MSNSSLFELAADNAAPMQPPPSKAYGGKRSGFDVAAFLTGVDCAPLTETSAALQLLPDPVRSAAERIAESMFLEGVGKLVKRMGTSGTTLERRPGVVAHSAKLEVFSAVSGLAWLPWHLADKALVDAVSEEIRNSGDLGVGQAHFEKVRSVNLFVAALPADSRESYLRSVAALIKGRRVRAVVLDAELVEWWPQKSFASACEQIGLRPMFVAIAERSAAGLHSILSDRRFGQPVAVDSSGTQLAFDDAGAVTLGSLGKTNGDRAARTGDSKPTEGPSVAVASEPSGAVASRIDALRDRQARYRNAGRTARPA